MKNFVSLGAGLALLVSSAMTTAIETGQDSLEEQSATVNVEKITENCEKQYTSESYADENERNNLIDQCVENEMSKYPAPSEEG